MVFNDTLEAASQQIIALDRDACIDQLLHFPELPLDFTPEFLDGQTLERLRHLLLAAVWRTYRRRSPL